MHNEKKQRGRKNETQTSRQIHGPRCGSCLSAGRKAVKLLVTQKAIGICCD